MNELAIIEKKDVRDQYMDRIEVLDKVKALMLLPDIQLATTEQVANFYEVDKTVIYATIHDNKDELISDGYAVLKRNDFLGTYSKQVPKITSLRGAFEVQFSNGEVRKFPHNGIGLFPRRAILRVGMLLRDSKVAKEVRTQLLNIEEKVTVEQKVITIDEEKQLLINIVTASTSEDIALAVGELRRFKDRQITKLSEQIEVDKPHTNLGKMISVTNDCVDFQQFGLTTGIGRNNLFELLRKKDVIRPGTTVPYQQFVRQGYFKVAEKVRGDSSGASYVYYKTYITGKGQPWVLKILGYGVN